MVKGNILVSIVILNYDGKKLLATLLKSLEKMDFPNNKIEYILVDNGSTDGSQDFIKQKYPYIQLIENKENLGYDEGMNIGVRQCKGKYVTMLSNDLVVHKNWLKGMVEAIELSSKIGSVNPKVYTKDENGKYIFPSYGTTTLLQYLSLLRKVDKNTKDVMKVFNACGSPLYRRDIVDVPFDADYFFYAEDTYFSWLVRLKGYEVVQSPSAILYHEDAATVKKLKNKNTLSIYFAERNRFLNMFTFYETKTLLKLIPLIIPFVIFLNIYEFNRIGIRIKIYFWLLFNIKTILIKRKNIQKQRKVSDQKIMRYMSCKFLDTYSIKNRFFKEIINILNKIEFQYCKLVNIKTIEFYGSRFDIIKPKKQNLTNTKT